MALNCFLHINSLQCVAVVLTSCFNVYLKCPPAQNHKLIFAFYSLFHFFGCKVQVAVTDPLHLKPVPEVSIATALKLNL